MNIAKVKSLLSLKHITLRQPKQILFCIICFEELERHSVILTAERELTIYDVSFNDVVL